MHAYISYGLYRASKMDIDRVFKLFKKCSYKTKNLILIDFKTTLHEAIWSCKLVLLYRWDLCLNKNCIFKFD